MSSIYLILFSPTSTTQLIWINHQASARRLHKIPRKHNSPLLFSHPWLPPWNSGEALFKKQQPPDNSRTFPPKKQNHGLVKMNIATHHLQWRGKTKTQKQTCLMFSLWHTCSSVMFSTGAKPLCQPLSTCNRSFPNCNRRVSYYFLRIHQLQHSQSFILIAIMIGQSSRIIHPSSYLHPSPRKSLLFMPPYGWTETHAL